jgi:hypothetical protein
LLQPTERLLANAAKVGEKDIVRLYSNPPLKDWRADCHTLLEDRVLNSDPNPSLRRLNRFIMLKWLLILESRFSTEQ